METSTPSNDPGTLSFSGFPFNSSKKSKNLYIKYIYIYIYIKETQISHGSNK